MDAGLGGSFRLLMSAVEGAMNAIADAMNSTLQPFIQVELIEIPISEWADVDRLEGYPRLYDRKLMDFELPDGSTIQAWIYIMNELPPQAKVISSGDWKNR